MSTLGKPSPGGVTKAFGVGGHRGTDRGHGNGLIVYAMADGTVTGVRDFADYGLTVTISHGSLIGGKRTVTRYRHLSSASVSVGREVGRGEPIAVQGADGYLTNEVHLHTELLLNGVLTDEQTYQQQPAGQTGTATQGSILHMRIIQDLTTLKYWRIGEFTALELSPGVAASEATVWGNAIAVSSAVCNQVILDTQTVRNQFLALIPSGGGGYNPTDADVVDEAELGGALTSTVSLINAAALVNRDAIIAKIDGLGISHT